MHFSFSVKRDMIERDLNKKSNEMIMKVMIMIMKWLNKKVFNFLKFVRRIKLIFLRKVQFFINCSIIHVIGDS